MQASDRDLFERFDAAKTNAYLWQNLFYQAYKYFAPNRNIVYNYETSGQKRGLDVYDTSAIAATKAFVSKTQASITPLMSQFAQLTPGPALEGAQVYNAQTQLEPINNQIYKALYSQKSNFTVAVNSAYLDLAIGTMAIIVRENNDDDNPFSCSHIPLAYFYPDDCGDGPIDAGWRQYQNFPIRLIKQYWPKAELTQELSAALEADWGATTNLFEGITYDAHIGSKEKYRYVVGIQDSQAIIYEARAPSSPLIVARWSHTTGERYGRGVALDALPTFQSMNAMMRDFLKSTALHSNGLWIGENQKGFNTRMINLSPGSIVTSKRIAGQWPLQPLEIPGNPEFNQRAYQVFAEQLNKLMLVNPISDASTPVQTATFHTLQQQEYSELAGPSFARLIEEFVTPLMHRLVYIDKRRGLIPNIEIDGQEISLNVQTPIAQSSGLQSSFALSQFMQQLQQMIGPQLSVAALNVPELPQTLAQYHGIDMSLVKSSEQLTQSAQEISQRIEQSQQPTQLLPPANQAPASVEDAILKGEGLG